MKTRCPGCQTTFRVTPEQLKARAGKVRCGECQTVFNALDNLLEEGMPSAPPAPPAAEPPPPVAAPAADPAPSFEAAAAPETLTPAAPAEAATPGTPLTEEAAQALAIATGLVVPRETTEIPGYSKWAEGVMSSPASPSAGRSARWPFTLAALLLVLALGVQLAFHFRSGIAVAAPSLRPLLAALSEAFGAGLPLPQHVDLVSIETSDLQADPTRRGLLILQATLRNRAAYGQAYPLLELTLTDTQDNPIARRVFQPDEYLAPQNPPEQGFPANTDTPVRLWIEAKDITAAGYRLYVFYP